MSSADGRSAREYHELTKHEPGLDDRRLIDPGIIPRLSKRYRDLAALTLPSPEPPPRPGGPFDAQTLSCLLHFSAGILRRRLIAGRNLEFRAASCTGAAYHVEAYVVCDDLPGIAAGVYHYDAQDESLRLLRQGDFRRALSGAVCEESLAGCRAAIVLTSTFWRNAWRYGDRAYRHVFWDSGTIAANLLVLSLQGDKQTRLFTSFVDSEVNRLLGADGLREAAVCVLALNEGEVAGDLREVEVIDHAVEPLSRVEIEYPLIWRTHEESSLSDCEEVSLWRRSLTASGADIAQRMPAPLGQIEEVIKRRGSARRFSNEAIGLAELRTVLETACARLDVDATTSSVLEDPLLIVNAVEGLAAGTYRYSRDGGRFELLEVGTFRDAAAHLALDQTKAGQAAVNVYFLARLDGLLSALGDRGYRAAQIEAGVRSGFVYLASTAQGLKATGLTFYDDEVARFFRLDTSETAVLLLMAAGR
jgi:SagB-type dehydrogenase family enzyme